LDMIEGRGGTRKKELEILQEKRPRPRQIGVSQKGRRKSEEKRGRKKSTNQIFSEEGGRNMEGEEGELGKEVSIASSSATEKTSS